MSALDHHLRLSHELLARAHAGATYRAMLDEVIGFSTDGVMISTAEHVAPFNRERTISILPQMALQAARLRGPATILILAGSLIPLDNFHYPRGFLLPEGARWNQRFNLYPSRMKKAAPLMLPPVNGTTHSEADKFFQSYSWLKDTVNKVAAFETYAHQLSACMEVISRKWFEDVAVPELKVRPLEAVARQMLLRLIEEGDVVIDSILFDPRLRGEIARRLHGVFCAWGERQGSFLFWGNRDSRASRLQEHEGALVGGNIEVVLAKDSVADALRKGQLWPGAFLSLLVVSYLPGLPISGGPKQLQYYRSMIQAANSLGIEVRPESLSQQGYMTFDLCDLRLRRGDSQCFSDFGTGLALSRSGFELDFLIEQMSAIEVVDPWGILYRYE